jgi:hypothetical protein
MIFFIAGLTIFLIFVVGVIGGMGLLNHTEASTRHDHWMSRLVDWLF